MFSTRLVSTLSMSCVSFTNVCSMFISLHIFYRIALHFHIQIEWIRVLCTRLSDIVSLNIFDCVCVAMRLLSWNLREKDWKNWFSPRAANMASSRRTLFTQLWNTLASHATADTHFAGHNKFSMCRCCCRAKIFKCHVGNVTACNAATWIPPGFGFRLLAEFGFSQRTVWRDTRKSVCVCAVCTVLWLRNSIVVVNCVLRS